MKARPQVTALLLLLSVLTAPVALYGQTRGRGDGRGLARRVRAEFLHAWRGYVKYAWGHDDLRPLSKKAHDWYEQSLYMTPVDALDTLILMNLKGEARRTKQLILMNLSFDKDIYVKNFEITIRLLGGLLSSYQLTGDRRLLVPSRCGTGTASNPKR